MTLTKFKFKPVEISWVDSEHESSWSTLDEVVSDESSLECRSCGYLVADKDDRVILATSVTTAEELEDQISAYITIPRASINWVRELRKR